MVPQHHEPGAAAEVDLGKSWVRFPGGPEKFDLFTMRVWASGAAFRLPVRAAPPAGLARSPRRDLRRLRGGSRRSDAGAPPMRRSQRRRHRTAGTRAARPRPTPPPAIRPPRRRPPPPADPPAPRSPRADLRGPRPVRPKTRRCEGPGGPERHGPARGDLAVPPAFPVVHPPRSPRPPMTTTNAHPSPAPTRVVARTINPGAHRWGQSTMPFPQRSGAACTRRTPHIAEATCRRRSGPRIGEGTDRGSVRAPGRRATRSAARGGSASAGRGAGRGLARRRRAGGRPARRLRV